MDLLIIGLLISTFSVIRINIMFKFKFGEPDDSNVQFTPNITLRQAKKEINSKYWKGVEHSELFNPDLKEGPQE